MPSSLCCMVNSSDGCREMPPVPEEFLCPIALDIMTDPVIMIETAMNYDRSSIEQHFACGNEICPLSGAAWCRPECWAA